MENLCRQFWICGALVPAEWYWLMPAIIPLLFVIVVVVPVANILQRVGRSRWWTIIAFMPVLNLIALWVFAFSRWPKCEKSPN